MGKSKNSFEDLRRKARETAATRWSRRELAQIGLLKGAHQESIAVLLRDCPVRVLASGEVLLQAGESCNACFMVLSGRLGPADPMAASAATFFEVGASIGELFLREKVVFDSAIAAVEPTRVLVVGRETGWALIRKSPQIADNWLSLFTERRRVNAAGAGRDVAPAPRETSETERAGLHNRSWLESMLPRQIARSRAGDEPLALLLIEIDGFTDYVARFGDARGDEAYQAVAQAIVFNVRPTDTVVSYGASRLAVVLLATNATNACIVGERVRKAVSQAGTLAPEQSVLHSLTLSVGVSELQSSADASALLAAADTALQMVRSRGGDRVAMQ